MNDVMRTNIFNSIELVTSSWQMQNGSLKIKGNKEGCTSGSLTKGCVAIRCGALDRLCSVEAS